MARRYTFICNQCELEVVCESETPPRGWLILVVPQLGNADVCSRTCLNLTLDQAEGELAKLPPEPPAQLRLAPFPFPPG